MNEYIIKLSDIQLTLPTLSYIISVGQMLQDVQDDIANPLEGTSFQGVLSVLYGTDHRGWLLTVYLSNHLLMMFTSTPAITDTMNVARYSKKTPPSVASLGKQQ